MYDTHVKASMFHAGRLRALGLRTHEGRLLVALTLLFDTCVALCHCVAIVLNMYGSYRHLTAQSQRHL